MQVAIPTLKFSGTCRIKVCLGDWIQLLFTKAYIKLPAVVKRLWVLVGGGKGTWNINLCDTIGYIFKRIRRHHMLACNVQRRRHPQIFLRSPKVTLPRSCYALGNICSFCMLKTCNLAFLLSLTDNSSWGGLDLKSPWVPSLVLAWLTCLL